MKQCKHSRLVHENIPDGYKVAASCGISRPISERACGDIMMFLLQGETQIRVAKIISTTFSPKVRICFLANRMDFSMSVPFTSVYLLFSFSGGSAMDNGLTPNGDKKLLVLDILRHCFVCPGPLRGEAHLHRGWRRCCSQQCSLRSSPTWR